MKTLKKSLLLVGLASIATLGANAGMTQDYKPYVGLKVANIMFDDLGDADIDDVTGVGIYGGFENQNGFGVELDYLKTGDTDVEYKGDKIADAEYQTYGVSGVYRYNLSGVDLNNGFYLKGKLGVRNVELELDGDGYNSEDDETDFTWGAGVGYKINEKFDTELSYDQHESDVDAVSLSARMKF